VNLKEAQSSIFKCIEELEADMENGLTGGRVSKEALRTLDNVAKVGKEVKAVSV
jgi:hypothetical protein